MYHIDQEKCLKDGQCIEACPVAAISKSEEGNLSVGEDCTDCGACEPVCETEAIQPME